MDSGKVMRHKRFDRVKQLSSSGQQRYNKVEVEYENWIAHDSISHCLAKVVLSHA